jgi:DNA-3-methyladenine glycosylase II
MADDFSKLNQKAHRFLLKQADGLSGKKNKLYTLLKAAGAVALPSKRRGSLLYTLARAIVGQQVAAKVAAVFWQRVLAEAAKAGSLEKLLAPRYAKKIRACGLSNNKTRFLVSLGDALRAKELSARRVISLPHPERIAYLTRLDGIGPWTADMVGIFYCRDIDIWPQGDLAVRNTFATLVQKDEAQIEAIAALFSPYRTFLALHMWQEKNNPMIEN